jgi:cobalt-zinc-cadmium efflux system membrane fusion protein
MPSRASPASILVVDDDVLLLQVLGRVLEREGYTVFPASSVEQALRVAEQHVPQLAVLDLSFPDGDGVELGDKLRARHPGLPLILMTAYPLRLREYPQLTRAFSRVLTKPAELEELRSAVKTALIGGPMQSSDASACADRIDPAPVEAHSSSSSVPGEAGVEVPAALDEAASPPSRLAWVKSAVAALIVLLVLGAFIVFVAEIPLPGLSASAKEQQPPPRSALPAVELVSGKAHTLLVPEDVRTALGIRKNGVDLVALAKPPTQTRPLVLPGSTMLDPARLTRIRARFAPAEVVEIAEIVDEGRTATGRTITRELHPGDYVKKGDKLGVFFSVDVGSKKNDLLDALVQMILDQEIFDDSEKAAAAGALPKVTLLTNWRNVQGDRNAISRAMNNLKVWNIPQRELDDLHAEAKKLSKNKDEWFKTPEGRWAMGERAKDTAGANDDLINKDDPWGRVTLRAPIDGVIVERNVNLHEMVVDNTVNLFQIAQVDRLLVIMNAPEDELRTLKALTFEQRRWTVQTVGAPAEGIQGTISEISYLIDPNQHTAIIKGYIDNPGHKIIAGQFATATIRIPPPEGVVEIPIYALVDDGQQSLVFVETDAAKHHYTMRRVQVTHRFANTAFIRSTPIPKEEQLTKEEQEQGLMPKEPLRTGERILQSGTGELKAALLSLESQPEKAPQKDKR